MHLQVDDLQASVEKGSDDALLQLEAYKEVPSHSPITIRLSARREDRPVSRVCGGGVGVCGVGVGVGGGGVGWGWVGVGGAREARSNAGALTCHTMTITLTGKNWVVVPNVHLCCRNCL